LATESVGLIEYTLVSYIHAHDELICEGTSINIIPAGQAALWDFGALTALWYIWRGLLFFPTPSLAPVVSAKLTLCLSGDASDTEFDIVVVSGDDLVFPALNPANYGYLLDKVTSFGSINTAGLVVDVPFDIPLNALGIATIAGGGLTRFGLRSSRDIAAIDPNIPPPVSPIVPSHNEFAFGYGNLEAYSVVPKLVIAH
jgi:hypothetical protein